MFLDKCKSLVPVLIKDLVKQNILVLKNNPSGLCREHCFLYKKPRFIEQEISLLRRPFKLPDTASFLSMYKEIFVNESYKFYQTSESPVILDVGANIGLSVLFFKKEYPKAKVLAFEADPKIFNYLKFNTKGLDGVELIPKAVFDVETELDFVSDSADGGSLLQKSQNSIKVKTCLLSKYLDKPIDFLKIDIEGAECSVLKECEQKLENVKNLFVEYHSFQGEEQNLHELLAVLSRAGFRYYISRIEHCSPQPFIKGTSNYNMDLQLNISCVRHV